MLANPNSSAQRWESKNGGGKGLGWRLHPPATKVSRGDTHIQTFPIFPQPIRVFWPRAWGAFDHGCNLEHGSVPRGASALFVFVSNSATNPLFRKFLSFTHCGFWRLKAQNMLPGYHWLDKISEEKIMQRITRRNEIAQEMLLHCLRH